ncbi:hypothetical protein [Lysinibacter cavernae]|nr:hypothetical protein [Lysinibacter cavernae]
MEKNSSEMKMILVIAATIAIVLTGCSDRTQHLGDPNLASPLGPYWNAIESSAANDQKNSPNSEISYGELVARCMKEQGFDYWPEPIKGETNSTVDADVDEQILIALENGYGIVPRFEALDGTVASEENQDENELYVSTMTSSQFDAYTLALYGPVWNELTDAAQSGDNVTWEWEEAGCDGVATHAVESETIMFSPNDDVTPFDDLIEQMYAISEQTLQTNTGKQLLNNWSLCMAQSKFDYLSWNEIPGQIQNEYDALIAEAQPTALLDQDVVFVDETNSGLPDRERLELLYEKEREVAAADLRCQFEVGRDELEREIQVELEREFVAQNHDRLSKMLSWFELHNS